MAEDMGDRTELPTGRRLSEARSRGQIAKSHDLSAAVDLIGALVVLLVLGGTMIRIAGTSMRSLLAELWTARQFDAVVPDLWRCALDLAKILGPFLGLLFLIGVLAQYMQVGVMFTTQPLQPKWNKLNPVNGLGGLFGRRGLVKTGINALKCLAVLGIGYSYISGVLPSLAQLPALTVFAAVSVIGNAVLKLVLWLLALLLVIGVTDYVYQRWQHTQDLKMTKEDVKDERRSMEGDPHIKGARLKMARKIAMQRINSAVPKADVVVTNPTHFSVAIQYDAATMRAPKVVAKGVDLLAMKIREVAIAHGVPIVERPPLARALYWGVDEGHEVQPEHYQAIAEILAFVYRLEEQQTAA